MNQPTNFLLSGLGSIPESETSERSVSCQHQVPSRPEEVRQVQPGSALADALQEFLLPPDPPGMESLYEEDGDSFHDVSMFDRCSSASSDSSIDIAFVKCPKAPSASHHALAANISTTRDVFENARNQGNGYNKLPNRGCVSPDESIMMRRNQHRPLQASQRKSKVSFSCKRYLLFFFMCKAVNCASFLLSVVTEWPADGQCSKYFGQQTTVRPPAQGGTGQPRQAGAPGQQRQ